ALAACLSGKRLSVLSPLLGLEVFVDMRSAPGLLRIDLAEVDRHGEECRPGQSGHHVQGGKPQGLGALAEIYTQHSNCLAWLFDMDDAFGKVEPSAKRGPRPVQHRIPGFVLAANQR